MKLAAMSLMALAVSATVHALNPVELAAPDVANLAKSPAARAFILKNLKIDVAAIAGDSSQLTKAISKLTKAEEQAAVTSALGVYALNARKLIANSAPEAYDSVFQDAFTNVKISAASIAAASAASVSRANTTATVDPAGAPQNEAISCMAGTDADFIKKIEDKEAGNPDFDKAAFEANVAAKTALRGMCDNEGGEGVVAFGDEALVNWNNIATKIRLSARTACGAAKDFVTCVATSAIGILGDAIADTKDAAKQLITECNVFGRPNLAAVAP